MDELLTRGGVKEEAVQERERERSIRRGGINGDGLGEVRSGES